LSKKVVIKFGGSSVKDANAFLRCYSIICKNPDTKLVILSATYNTTNDLENLYQRIINKQDFSDVKEKLIERHRHILNELNLSPDISNSIIDKLENYILECKTSAQYLPQMMDKFYSIGELWSSRIFYELLKSKDSSVELLYSPDLIKTDSLFTMSNVDLETSRSNAKELKERMNEEFIFIAQGFIGSDNQGDITTLGREGSDYSATILANILELDEVQIWTDVEGIANCDPSVVEGSTFFKNLSYDQAELMATHGAKVLFSRTLSPIKDLKIPLFVRSTLNPDGKGTLVSDTPYTESDFLALTFQKRGSSYIIYLLGQNLENFSDQIYSLNPIDFTDNKVTFMNEEKLHLEAQKVFDICLTLDKSSQPQGSRSLNSEPL
tara:strand:+ start:54162 stop:55301 length:1140 start_codon:yes stop_codon:yes gene_type:complete